MAKIEFDGSVFTYQSKPRLIPGKTLTTTLGSNYAHIGTCDKKWKGEYDDESGEVVLDCKHCGAHYEFQLGMAEPEE